MLSQAPPSPARLPDGPLKVGIEPLPALDRLAPMWRALEARSAARFFLTWSWIGAWLETIGCRPDLLIARRGDDVVGLALVHVRQKVRHRVLPVWTLYLHQTGDEDQDVVTIEYNDILADRRMAAAVRAACLRYLVEARTIGGRRVGELVLGGLDETLTAGVTALGRPVRELAGAGSALVDLGAIRQAGGDYLASLKPALGRRIRRALTLYRERGEVEIAAAATVDEALAFFDQAGALHQQRWIARGRPGAFAYPFYVAFHRALIRSALPAGKVELVRVAAGGEPIGFLYNFLDRGRVYYYFSGLRFEADNRLKPGLVCHALCIQRHLERGMAVYDFMAGNNRYKTELGRPGPRIVSLAVQRPSLLLAAERPLRRLKQALAER